MDQYDDMLPSNGYISELPELKLEESSGSNMNIAVERPPVEPGQSLVQNEDTYAEHQQHTKTGTDVFVDLNFNLLKTRSNFVYTSIMPWAAVC